MPNKHILLVEIDWDTGTEGYGFERYRTPTLDYQDLLLSASDVKRSMSPFGDLSFPTCTLQLANRDLYFTKKFAVTPHRNKTVRIKIIAPDETLSDAVIVFTGTIVRAPIKNGVLTLETSANNFEELFASDLSHVLPVLNKGLFPNLPDGQTPTTVPLIYGRLHSTSGEDLLDQNVTPAVAPAYLIDTENVVTENWSGFDSAANRTWVGVAYSPSLELFVAVSSNGGTTEAVMTSVDGETWTLRTTPTSQTWSDICWSETLNLFVAVGNNTSSGSGVMTSPDGINWSDRTAASARSWRGIAAAPADSTAYAAGIALVAVAGSGDSSRVMTSIDGTVWVSQTAASSNTWNSVAYVTDAIGFVAVASTGTGDRVMSSTTGTTWVSRASAADNQWFGIAYSPQLELLVVVGASGTGDRVMVSEDAITWFLVATPADKDWSRVAWSPSLGLFAATGFGATGTDLMTSSDGVEWVTHTNPSGVVWVDIAWGEEPGIFVAVGGALTNGTMHSPNDLGSKYLYALGTGALSGDNNNTGFSEFVFNYGTRVPLKKTLSQETYGDFSVTILGFAVDQRDVERPNEQEITSYISGIRTGGAGTNPYLNPPEIKEHFLLNYAKVASAQIDTTAQTAAEAAAEVMHTADDDSGGIAPASCGILLKDLHESFRSIIQKMDTSFGMATAQVLGGKLASIVLTLGAEPAAVADLNDETAILKDSLGIDDPQEVATVLQLNFAERSTSGGRGDPTGTVNPLSVSFSYELLKAKAEMFGASSTKFIEYDLSMPYCRRIGAALNVARALSEFLRPNAQRVTFDLPISYFDTIDVGDFVTVTHWQGTSAAGGYSAVSMQIMEISTILTPDSLRLQISAFRRAPGIAVHDNFDRTASNTLGSSWTESAGAVTALQIASAAGVEGPSFNQDQSLFLANNEVGIATWDVTTDSDQMASLQLIRFVDGNVAKFGVAVRSSGTYTNFTGYLALFENSSSGTAYVRLYRCSGTDLTASSGTQLGEKQLVFQDLSTSTWRGQGDIIEIRAVGTAIEVWYFSDIPANNFGKIIAVTDANITSGKLAIASRDGGASYATNFYGRSFT